MKRLISFMLCLALLLGMGAQAFADWSENTNSVRYDLISELVKQLDAANNKTDAVSSATGKPAANTEHVSLGIKIPSLDSFLGRRLDIYLYDVLKNYVHICYEDRVYEDELEDYMDLLEDDYDFQLAIYDWTRGIYAYNYYEEDIWTLYPGYGYKDEDDVAFMIVHDGDYTHVYYSIDFDYCHIDDCREDEEDDNPLSLSNYEKFREEKEKEWNRKILERRNKSDIELPDMGRFFGRDFGDYSEELTQSYSHLCYETEYDFDDIESYLELLEDDYKLKRIYPKGFDLEEGQYCFAYKGKGDVETFSPEYYGLGMEMAVFIACYPKYTHIYFSNDFNYDYWGDKR